jgi:hypothetical protein
MEQSEDSTVVEDTEESYKDALIKLQGEKIALLEKTIAEHTCQKQPIEFRPITSIRAARGKLEAKYARQPPDKQGSTDSKV